MDRTNFTLGMLGKTNVIADALSRRYNLLAILDAKVIGFEMIKEIYANDSDFCEMYNACLKEPQGVFHVQQGFLFKGNRLCIPKTPLRLSLVKEMHESSLSGHFGIQNTLDMLSEHFYWHKMLGTEPYWFMQEKLAATSKQEKSDTQRKIR
ncbi:uncharacterized protein LOC130805614 [Amaranthus tricolor]|uniref:uncharacterized protein LOC130805614 n=1 Tax=Amaranthus tricolor TaxID=29722 RepID=UPI002588B4F7|nr:uncharacterized protein LOC130805614 [Amaranthus tricolor]